MQPKSKPKSTLKERKKVPAAATPPTGLVPIAEILSPNLLLLPVSQLTLFPGMMVPLIFPEGKLTKTVEKVVETGGIVGVVLAKEPSNQDSVQRPQMPGFADENGVSESEPKAPFYPYGVAARVLKKINLPDNQVSVLLAGLQRFELKTLSADEPYFSGVVDYLYEDVKKDIELEAMVRSALAQFKQLSKDNPLISEEVKVALVNIDGPGKLADFMASVLIREVSDYQELLKTYEVKARVQKLLLLLKREQELQSVQRKINDEINSKVTSAQRDFYLQEQLKQIQKELGKASEKNKLLTKYEDRLKTKVLNEEAQTRIKEEFEKIENVSEQSSEFSVALNYLDWATALPWGVQTKENYTLQKAKQILDEDHFGLKDVKERILEHLAVKKLKSSNEGTILCFVGPPGTGKTSLGKSIARALERKFTRFSVGGMRDEAEIKGHRRTYVGAMPGKVIQGLKRTGYQNPVFLIDEVDKIGQFSHTGDPASALLEVLDPEQNKEFLDHYLDIPFDCSQVFFITTANTTDTIPAPLLDRMEVIHLSGYTDLEKVDIARNYLIPKSLSKNGLKPKDLKFGEKGLRHIIHRYARESGVRNLEKQIGKICRKVAFRLATGKTEPVVMEDAKVVEKFLGAPPFLPEEKIVAGVPGVSTGLAWTQYGGDILHIECKAVDGKGGLVLTGHLGDVMKESANIAYTYVRAYAGEEATKLKLPKDYFEKKQIHLHVPSGAIPKDGPSAGVAMVASLYSLISGKPVFSDVAMTGEISLTGRVLPVGGIKEKLLAAKRAGLKKILLPIANERELKEIDIEIRRNLEIVKIHHIDDSFRHLFA